MDTMQLAPLNTVFPCSKPAVMTLHLDSAQKASDNSAPRSPLAAARWRAAGTAVLASVRLASLRDQLGEGAYVDWQELEEGMIVGKGAFATVTKCTYTPASGKARVVAVKQVRTELLGRPAEVDAFVDEAKLLRKLRHSYIVRFYGCGWSRVTEEEESAHGGRHPPSEQQLFFVQEFCEGGTLHALVAEANRGSRDYSDQDALRWALQIALALECLHTRRPKVIHRDLKLENILLTNRRVSKSSVKLADFGLARRLQNNAPRSNKNSSPHVLTRMASTRLDELDSPRKASVANLERNLEAWMAQPLGDLGKDASYHGEEMTAKAGSMGYMAPEVLQGKPYNEKADVFSFGIILYNLFHRNIPSHQILQHGNFRDLEAHAHKVAHGFRQKIQPQIPPGVRSLIERCWDGQPQLRPSMSQVVQELQDMQPPLEPEESPRQVAGGSSDTGGCCNVQ